MEDKDGESSRQNNEKKEVGATSVSNFYHTDKQKEILNDLNTNPKYTKFFEKYNRNSVQRFKENYAIAKSYVISNEGRALEEEEDRLLKYQLMAEEYIWHIQQRKLFDLQIKWRAEQIELEGVEAIADFEEWSENIEKCPFLTPISQEEFDLYISFVESSKMEDIQTNYLTKWQEYEDFKAQYDDIESDLYVYEIPGWYEYYENKTGLGALYMLKDIRGEKEGVYMKIYRENVYRQFEEKNKDKPKPEPDERPNILYYDKEVIQEFLSLFETGNFIHNWEAYHRSLESDNNDLDYAIYTLSTATENCEIEYNYNWRAGIIYTANEYDRKMLLAAMPKAYNDYLFRINSGLGFDSHFEKRRPFKAALVKEAILGGREMNGEPRDFNF